MRTTVVLVNWRTAEHTLNLLRMLPLAANTDMRVVIVENGSRDGSADVIRAALCADPGLAVAVELVEQPTNDGFTSGLNVGVERALRDSAVEALWLLNPDSRPGPDTFEELKAVLHDSGAGVVSARMQFGKQLWVGDRKFPRAFWARPRDYRFPEPRHRRWWPSERFESGCALFDVNAVRELIRRDGYFLDEGLFLYWDEYECSRRLARDGVSIVIARNTLVHHGKGWIEGSARNARVRQYYVARNAILVTRREVRGLKFWAMLAVRLSRDFAWFAREALHRQGPHPRSYILGTIDGLRGSSGRWSQHSE